MGQAVGALIAAVGEILAAVITGLISGLLSGIVSASVALAQGGKLGDALKMIGESTLSGAISGFAKGIADVLAKAFEWGQNFMGAIEKVKDAAITSKDFWIGIACSAALNFTVMATSQAVMTGSVNWGRL